MTVICSCQTNSKSNQKTIGNNCPHQCGIPRPNLRSWRSWQCGTNQSSNNTEWKCYKETLSWNDSSHKKSIKKYIYKYILHERDAIRRWFFTFYFFLFYFLYNAAMRWTLYYSTNSGNTQLVGEALQGFLQKYGINLVLQNIAEDTTWFKDANPEDRITTLIGGIQKSALNNFILLGCGTYGHGQLEKTMRKTLEETWNHIDLDGIPCSCIGLGDHRYEREYCMYSAFLLESWLKEHGGNTLLHPLRINRSPLKPNNQKIIENWVGNFVEKLRA